MNPRSFTRLLLAFAATACMSSAFAVSEAAPGAEVYFENLKDGQTISSPFTVQFGIKNMAVIPAGTEHSHSGHHHLLINVDDIDLTAPIPADDNHRHFGGGQTEVLLDLEPGTYDLQLLLGDHLHRPHDKPVMSQKISVVVAE